jgi:hypothetical protein
MPLLNYGDASVTNENRHIDTEKHVVMMSFCFTNRADAQTDTLFFLFIKAIPVTGRGDPYVYETSRLLHFLDNRLTYGGEVVGLTRQPLPPGRFLVLISVRG